MSESNTTSAELPEELERLFWEYDPSTLTWTEHGDFIARRVLSHGRWSDIQWLRGRVSDDELRALLRENRGRGLSPRKLRLWQVLLDIPESEVDDWLAERESAIWEERTP